MKVLHFINKYPLIILFELSVFCLAIFIFLNVDFGFMNDQYTEVPCEFLANQIKNYTKIPLNPFDQRDIFSPNLPLKTCIKISKNNTEKRISIKFACGTFIFLLFNWIGLMSLYDTFELVEIGGIQVWQSI